MHLQVEVRRREERRAGLLPDRVRHGPALSVIMQRTSPPGLNKNNNLSFTSGAFNQVVAGSIPARPTNKNNDL
jgi:hypothetical protein